MVRRGKSKTGASASLERRKKAPKIPADTQITYFGGCNWAFFYEMSLVGGIFESRPKDKVQVHNIWREGRHLKIQMERGGDIISIDLPAKWNLQEVAGGPVNQAVTMSALGVAEITVFGLTGVDREKSYRSNLPAGVKFRAVETQPEAITYSLVTSTDGSVEPGSTLHLMRKGRTFELPPDLVDRVVATEPNLMVVSSLPVDVEVLTFVRDLFWELAARYSGHCRTVFIPSMAQIAQANQDPAYKRLLMQVLEQCYFIHMNVAEAARLRHGDKPVVASEAMILEFARSLPKADSIPLVQRVVSVTRDRHGATTVVGGHERGLITVPAITTRLKPVVDPTGAGDIWIAIFTLLLSLYGFGRSAIEAAMTVATIAARENITEIGSRPVASGQHPVNENWLRRTWLKHKKH